MYESVYNNQGVINGYDSIGNQIKIMAIPKESENYQGEYFLKNGFGKVNKFLFSPNLFNFDLHVYADDILVINQNYFPGWHASSGKIIDYGGLIGIALSKEISTLKVYYLPHSLILGISIFICFIAIIAYIKGWFCKISCSLFRTKIE